MAWSNVPSPSRSSRRLDAARGDVLRVRIPAHLDDVEPAVLVVAGGDGVGDQRLSGGLEELETLVKLEGLEGGGRFGRLDPGEFLGEVLLVTGQCGQRGKEESECEEAS